MSIFDKIGKAVTHAVKTVEKTGEKAADTVAKGVTDTADTVQKGVTDTAYDVGSGLVDTADTVAKGVTDTAYDVGSGLVDTADTVAKSFQQFGKSVKVTVDGVEHTVAKGAQAIYRDERLAITYVVNNAASTLTYVGHQVEEYSEIVIDDVGNLITEAEREIMSALDTLASKLKHELSHLGDGIKSDVEHLGDTLKSDVEHLGDGIKSDVEHAGQKIAADIKHDSIIGLKAIEQRAKHITDDVKSETLKIVHEAIDDTYGELRRDIYLVKGSVLRLEHDVIQIGREIEHKALQEAKGLLVAIEQALEKESLKLVYTIANGTRKLYREIQRKQPQALTLINSTPLTLEVGPIMMFYQNFADKANQVCELLLRYHHHPPPAQRGAILEMVDVLAPDFVMVNFTLSASLVIVNTSLLKAGIQAPFGDKTTLNWALNVLLKKIGVPAGDLSSIDFGVFDADAGDFDVSDVTEDVTADSDPDTVDSTYNPIGFVGQESDSDTPDTEDTDGDLTLDDDEISKILRDAGISLPDSIPPSTDPGIDDSLAQVDAAPELVGA